MKGSFFYKLVLLVSLFCLGQTSNAQVTIGTSTTPAKAAILQLKEWESSKNSDPSDKSNSSKGIGMACVELESLTSLSPFVDPASGDYELQKKLHQGMIVYNVNIDATKELELRPYTWNGAVWKEYLMRGGELSLDVTPSNVLYNVKVTNPSVIPINVKWSPAFIPVDIIVEHVDDRGVVGIDHAAPYKVPQITDNTGDYNFTIKPVGATPQELVDSLFLTRTTLLHMRGSDGTGKFLTKTITFLQKRHNLILEGIDPYMEINREYKLTFRANSPWNLAITDPSVGGAFEILEIPTSDVGDNFTKTYSFKLKNDVALEGNKMAFDFTSPTGEFPPIKYSFIPTQTYPNSYIVKPGAAIQIPLNKAYIVWANDLKNAIPDGANIEAELVWQDAPSAINSVVVTPANGGIGSTIAVTTNAAAMPEGGNAVVAAKLNGKIIWSWHLWMTDYDPNKKTDGSAVDFDALSGFTPAEPMSEVVNTKGDGKVYGYYNGKHTNIFMDRVLGATVLFDIAMPVDNARGFFYQHGRKDPLPPALLGTAALSYTKRILYDISGTILTDWHPVDNIDPTGFNTRNIITEPEQIYLEESIRKPLDFFSIGDVKDENGVTIAPAGKNDFDWYSNIAAVHKGDMWNRSDNTKGNYDPCPDGWRVHPGGTGYNNPFLGVPFADVTKVESLSIILGGNNAFRVLNTDFDIPYLGSFIIQGYLSAPTDTQGAVVTQGANNFVRFATSFGARSISPQLNWWQPIKPVTSNIFGMNAKAHGYNIRCTRDFSNK